MKLHKILHAICDILRVISRYRHVRFYCSDEPEGAEGLTNANTMQSNADSNVDLTMVTSSNVLATPGLNNPSWNRQQAVSVRHAFKIYGSSKNPNHVIQNLSMTVAKGSM